MASAVRRAAVLALAWRAAAAAGLAEVAPNSSSSATCSCSSCSSSHHDADFSVSVTLIGSVAFMMGLFYLTNHEDTRKANNTWKLISATVSIFSAVLVFNGVNGVLDAVLRTRGANESVKLGASFTHMLVWMVFLHVLLEKTSDGLRGAEEKVQEFELAAKVAELNMKSCVVLLGHITGFAAIRAFSRWQQMLPRGPASKAVVVPVSWFALFLLDTIGKRIRERHILEDGVVSRLETVWRALAEEYDYDIIGLTSAWLTVQVVRYWLTGHLPNLEGQYEAQEQQDRLPFSLLIVGIAVGVIEGVRLVAVPVTSGRLTAQLQRVTAMVMAWTLFYCADGFFTLHAPLLRGVVKRVVVALIVSLLSMACIFSLEDLEELVARSAARGGRAHAGARVLNVKFEEFKFLKSCERGMATLIGFAWEQVFDMAVNGVSESEYAPQLLPPCITKLLLALVLVLLVVPAWRLYILPRIIDQDEEEEDEEGWEAACTRNASTKGLRRTATGMLETTMRRVTPQARHSVTPTVPPRGPSRVDPRGEPPNPPASEQALALPAQPEARGPRGPLLDDLGGPSRQGSALAGHRARAAELARQRAEIDAKLDATVAQLGALERRSAELLARRG